MVPYYVCVSSLEIRNDYIIMNQSENHQCSFEATLIVSNRKLILQFVSSCQFPMKLLPYTYRFLHNYHDNAC